MADITIEGPDGRFVAPEGTPIPEGYRLVQAPPPEKSLSAVLVDIAKGAALPTVGQIGGAALGGALGGMVTGPLAPIGVPVGGAIGGALGGAIGAFSGAAANQALGITKRSNLGLGLAAAGGVASPIIGKGLQIVKRGAQNLPGVAQWLQGRAMSGIKGAIGEATPAPGDVDAAYGAARASSGAAGPAPPMPELTARMVDGGGSADRLRGLLRGPVGQG